jgi:hypothetical protein
VNLSTTTSIDTDQASSWPAPARSEVGSPSAVLVFEDPGGASFRHVPALRFTILGKAHRMIIPKHVILDELRRRGLEHRADFVDRQLPDDVDTQRHGGLLATLHLDLDQLASAAGERPAGAASD